MQRKNRIFFESFAEAAGHVVDLLSEQMTADAILVVTSEGNVSTVIKAFNRGRTLVREGQVIRFDAEFFEKWTDSHWDRPLVIPQTSRHPLTHNQYATRTYGDHALIGFPISYPDGRKYGALAALSASEPFRDKDMQLLTSMSLFLSYIVELERRVELDRDWIGRLAEDKRSMENLAEAYLDEAKAAQRSTREKADFLAIMTHEIRNSLNGSVAMSDLLLTTELAPDQRNYLDMIRSSNDTLLTLANNILDFSKLEAGKHNVEEAPFDLISTIEDVACLLAPRTIEQQVELILDLSGDLPAFVLGDAGKMRQILLNLLGNAVKFTHQGEIVVTARELPGTDGREANIELTISDTGIGIAEDKLKGLFDRYYQAHEAGGTFNYGGTGLGLSITQSLVELMGGKISVQSEAGRGTAFRIQIPFIRYGEFELETAARPLDGIRVLIVDDNETTLGVLECLLRSWGAQPFGVRTGEEGLERLKNGSFDLVLLDMHFENLAAQIREFGLTTPLGLLAPLGTVFDLQDKNSFRFIAFKPLRKLQLYSAIASVRS
ncbi:ATP-binding protein [Saccharibacillus sp. CPCC 101409]|uniref:hybrid sensor histidine kinase/response regulator n=1 Tax=Saccharibacillus sp. CPCC 101409 TaxID=3058041 RepID=UPI002670E853|nr:ATP-binding protein [Saccharibacillus sp. CPCC 101409]MDO3411633.1 ATP-binding protein [Saccharibacillus sp. CPCC 101409]